MGRFILCFLVFSSARPVFAQTLRSDVEPLIESSCIHCHDAATDTRLDFESLNDDLANPKTFRRWENIFDRVHNGEMPPDSEPRPDAAQLEQALSSLKEDLRETNLRAQRTDGRVRSRRLTRVEYEYTLHDLLKIRGELAKHLPPESSSSSFDTVSIGQGISPVHIRSYLAAADVALDEAINLGSRPRQGPRPIDYLNSPYIAMWLERPIRLGGQTIKVVDEALVLFDHRSYVTRSDAIGFRPVYSGVYRIRAEAFGYQAETPVTLALNKGSEKQGGSELIATFDLHPSETRTVEAELYLTPDDYFHLAAMNLDCDSSGRHIFAAGGAKGYDGEGVAVKWLTIQGPLEETWPPESTRTLFHGVTFGQRDTGGLNSLTRLFQGGRGDRRAFEIELAKEPAEHLLDVVEHLAPRLFRRPLNDGEADAFARLAEPALKEGRSFDEAVRVPLRAMLSSPQFLLHSGEPGELDEYALATRLSYFLWKSLPDDELFRLAHEQKLSDPDVLAQQADRMLDHEKSMRFVRDFLGQWLGLREIDATTPDDKLYPEYDDILRQAMLEETERFFKELLDKNLSAGHLIDSDFTFVNRRLAEHYGIPSVEREHFRRVSLAEDSVRGGLLTHASILKVTANGTVTSPVKRGNFVLSALLGTPPASPPPDIGSIEPDTRGTTTIRETLDAHRNTQACAKCHQQIDPPGFALECFDPIGGFRTRYRSTETGEVPDRKLFGRQIFEYKEGLPVDASGVTADGESFNGIREFKQHLLKQTDQVASHLISRLAVYATGGEIQFADRDEIARIAQETRNQDYPIRTIIHRIVQSKLFRNK